MFCSPVRQLVNGSALSEALQADSSVRSRGQPAVCLLVLFFGSSCPFSAAAAPHVNALPRAFPDLRVLAVDALDNGRSEPALEGIGSEFCTIFFVVKILVSFKLNCQIEIAESGLELIIS